MSLMSVKQVAEFLEIPDIRVERLARENLLVTSAQDDNGNPLFNEDDVKRYKVLAERLGGL